MAVTCVYMEFIEVYGNVSAATKGPLTGWLCLHVAAASSSCRKATSPINHSNGCMNGMIAPEYMQHAQPA